MMLPVRWDTVPVFRHIILDICMSRCSDHITASGDLINEIAEIQIAEIWSAHPNVDI